MERKQKKKRIWNHVRTLLLYMLLHNALFLVVFIPVSGQALSLAIKASRFSYLTIENIFSFLISPVTILMLLVLLAITSVFFYVEIVTISIYNQSKHSLDKIRLSHIVIPGVEEAIRLIKIKNNFLLPLFSTLSCLVYSLPLYIAMIFRQRISSYILRSIKSKTFVIPCFVLLLLIACVIVYQGMFTYFYVSYDRSDFFAGFRKSRQTIRKHRKQIALTLIKYNVLLCIIYAIVYCLVIVLMGLLTFFVMGEKLAVASFLTTYDQINRYYAIVAGVAGIIINLKVIYRLFIQYKSTINTVPYEISNRQEKVSRNRKYTSYVTIMSMLVVFVFSLMFIFKFRDSIFRQKAPIFGTYITAHRGYSSEAPENTLPSIEASIDAIADYVEIDVQETKDGVVVLLHDSNLKRTTGVNKNIWNVTYEELLGYNAAKRYKNFEPTSIPTLEEALLLCQNSIFMNIEIKITNHEQNLVEEVVRLIELYDMEDQCVISSTNYGALKRVKEANDSIKTGYILSFAYGYFYNREYADFFSVKSSFITQDMIRLAHGVGKEVHAWTVNDISEVERMKQLGVDNIITDYPIRIRECLYGDEETTSFIDFLRTLTD